MSAPVLGQTMTARRAATPIARVGALCRDAWGVEGRLIPLPSERDEIYRLDTNDGRRFTLKLTSPHEAPVATEFQTRALAHAALRDPSLPIPRLVPTRDGALSLRPDWPDQEAPTARLLSWLDGAPLASSARSLAQAASMGAGLARLGLALADFDHAGADHDLAWDLRHTARLRPLLGAIQDPERRALAEAAMDRFENDTAARLAPLRRQVVHNDLNPHNTLVDPQTLLLSGIIDFGDLVRTALVADVAIAACYLMSEGEDAMAAPLALVGAYHVVCPLEAREAALVAPLMEARHLMTVAITEWRAARNPENRAYITKNTAAAWRGLASFASRPTEQWSKGFIDIHDRGIG